MLGGKALARRVPRSFSARRKLMPRKDQAARRQYEQERWTRVKADPELRAATLERARAAWAARFASDPTEHNSRTRRYREQHREYGREYSKRRQRVVPEVYVAATAKRRAVKLQRTPAWADEEKIQRVYAEAKAKSAATGESWHVDHVVPLQGKLVSGFHVHYNLQVIPGAENSRKHNKFEPGDI